jgi:glycosyltransferase involved in cell wall biosynthesis
MPSAAAKPKRGPLGQARRECLICESPHLEYEFIVDRIPVCACQECGLLFLNPQPRDIGVEEGVAPLESHVLTEIYQANAAERLEALIAYSGIRGGSLLLIGADAHLSAEANKRGFEVYAFAPRDFESIANDELPNTVDGCVLFCALERMKDPLSALRTIRAALGRNGCLMVISPTTDSKTARLLRTSWWEFNTANLYYFSVDTLQNLLIKAGFGDPIISPDRSLVSLNYLRQRIAANPGRWQRSRWLRQILSLSPVFRNKTFRLLYGRTRFLVRSKAISSQPLLSVIVPVYNEQRTFVEMMEELLAKTIEGVDIEVVIVESNSTDGSRELALQYQNHPRVRLILEPRPYGKGHAVRAGLQAAKGSFVLFQDADLEYDINDYDALIAPLLRYQNNFVLGSRHGGRKNNWKVRQFIDSPGLATFFNFGHVLFLTLFNVLYRQQLSDPFTMFKVFRSECLYGLEFECNRFDFDYEIVIKFLRKGYKPVELPVNYRSRSMREGKKVTLIHDPLTWIRALFKFRTGPLYADLSQHRVES